jgi:hypothetical protein
MARYGDERNSRQWKARLCVLTGSIASWRVGVIGTGHCARAAHLPAFGTLLEVELVAVAGIDRREAEAAAHEFGVIQVFDSGSELIEHVRPDRRSPVSDCSNLVCRCPEIGDHLAHLLPVSA